jgi:hypothetical protein
MVLLWRRDRSWVILAVLGMLLLALGHGLLLSRYRYRLPFEPFLLFVGWIGVFQHPALARWRGANSAQPGPG